MSDQNNSVIIPVSITSKLETRSKFDIKQEVDRREFWDLCREVDEGLYTLASMIRINDILGELNSKLDSFETRVKNAMTHTETENIDRERFEPQFRPVEGKTNEWKKEE